MSEHPEHPTEGAISKRIRTLYATVDPDQTLPKVSFAPNLSLDPLLSPYAIYRGRVRVGTCNVTAVPASRHRYMSYIEIFNGENPHKPTSNYRGQGLGLATYLAMASRAIYDGYSFGNDAKRFETSDAKKIWDTLVVLGIARVIQPFSPLPGHSGLYRGEIVIDANQE